MHCNWPPALVAADFGGSRGTLAATVAVYSRGSTITARSHSWALGSSWKPTWSESSETCEAAPNVKGINPFPQLLR